KAAGLKRVTVSLDSLDAGVFARMSGGFGGVDEVLAGIEQARRAELTPVKINAVVQRGVNDHTVLELVEHFRGTGVIVRFIEYMDVGNRNHWRSELVVPSKELAERIGRRWPLAALEPGYRGEVARRYAFTDGEGEVASSRRCHSRSAATARVRACHPTAHSIPVCSPPTAPACATPCAVARA